MLPMIDSSLSLQAGDFAAMHAFYSGLLGAPHREKAGAWASFEAGSIHLILWHGKTPPPAAGALQLCFTVAHLEEARAHLPADSLPTDIVCASHGRELFFQDPDGNRLILYEPEHAPPGRV